YAERLAKKYIICFFFQAEDGIRDGHVTGVQTCALPISPRLVREVGARKALAHLSDLADQARRDASAIELFLENQAQSDTVKRTQIGRASCRERVKIAVVVGG